MAISAIARTNVRALLLKAAELLANLPEEEEEVEIPVYRLEADPREFTIKAVEQGWRVSGEAIERAAAMTYWEYDQSVRRFQHILQSLGIEEELRGLGVQEGDTVLIGEYELEWSD